MCFTEKKSRHNAEIYRLHINYSILLNFILFCHCCSLDSCFLEIHLIWFLEVHLAYVFYWTSAVKSSSRDSFTYANPSLRLFITRVLNERHSVYMISLPLNCWLLSSVVLHRLILLLCTDHPNISITGPLTVLTTLSAMPPNIIRIIKAVLMLILKTLNASIKHNFFFYCIPPPRAISLTYFVVPASNHITPPLLSSSSQNIMLYYSTPANPSVYQERIVPYPSANSDMLT